MKLVGGLERGPIKGRLQTFIIQFSGSFTWTSPDTLRMPFQLSNAFYSHIHPTQEENKGWQRRNFSYQYLPLFPIRLSLLISSFQLPALLSFSITYSIFFLPSLCISLSSLSPSFPSVFISVQSLNNCRSWQKIFCFFFLSAGWKGREYLRKPSVLLLLITVWTPNMDCCKTCDSFYLTALLFICSFVFVVNKKGFRDINHNLTIC